MLSRKLSLFLFGFWLLGIWQIAFWTITDDWENNWASEKPTVSSSYQSQSTDTQMHKM